VIAGRILYWIVHFALKVTRSHAQTNVKGRTCWCVVESEKSRLARLYIQARNVRLYFSLDASHYTEFLPQLLKLSQHITFQLDGLTVAFKVMLVHLLQASQLSNVLPEDTDSQLAHASEIVNNS
jgi:hypothetical protein